VEAAGILKGRVVDRHLLYAIAGSGSSNYRSSLERRAADLTVERDFRFGSPDHRDLDPEEMATLFRRAKVCVVPSRREGFGLVLLEAFVFRAPVVAANTGGIPDVVSAGVTGLLFHRDDPSDLANQIITLIEDNESARHIARAAYDRLCREFHASKMAERHFRFYKKVAGISV
jgi:glycosyltransferase involved in cell wall biosynthesis